ncbi:hypothetical protein C0991_007846 [Blastosporella zonata]|nr:hypothetical protein C0991_007846 [Blastosporella zonata]
MAVPSSSNYPRGKKRAYVEDREASSSLSPVPVATPSAPKVKKPKRAETRNCPVCDEVVPIRLLATHAELESQRLQAIFDQVGSTESIYEEPDYGLGSSLRSGRSSTLKIRKSGKGDTLQEAGKTIQTIKRHRKQRHSKLREMGREEERGRENLSWGEEIICPVCMVTVRGDQDVLDAHVDACLANESRRLEEERQLTLEERAAEDEVWEGSYADGAAGHVGNVRGAKFVSKKTLRVTENNKGTGFHTRNQNEEDVEDEIDVDGDEGFGDIQFTEGDVMPVTSSREVDQDLDVEIEGDGEDEAQQEQKILHDLVAEGKVVRNASGSGSGLEEAKAKMEEVMGLGDTEKMDLAVLAARKRGDKASLITALENKVTQLQHTKKMPLGPSSSAVHIHTTSTASAPNASRTPTSVNVHPVALFTILDHYLRRGDNQDRVIGTLLGTRTETEIEVKSSFAVLHSETSEQVAVDMEYHRAMYELHHKVNPKEVIVGWYSTGSNLNTYSALIQNFYSQETGPNQAIHLAINTGVEEDETAGVSAFVRHVIVHSPVGVFPKPENCVFVPVPVEIRFHDAERSGLDLLTKTATSPNATSSQPVSDLEILEQSILSVQSMLDRVLTYVQKVLSGKVKGDPAIGRYLMDTLGASTDDLNKGGFNASLQDTLMISYLANLVRSQAEVASRLALTATS